MPTKKPKNYSRGIAQRGFMEKIVPKNKFGSFQIKIGMYAWKNRNFHL